MEIGYKLYYVNIMGKPIRVLHILQRMEAAGVQTLLMNLYRYIDREQVQFDFLVHYTAPQFYDNEVVKMGGKIYRFSVREDYNFVNYIQSLNKFFYDHNEYKIVHGHMHSLGAVYLNAAKSANVPVRIAHSHTYNTLNNSKKIIKIFMNHQYSKYATDLFACSTEAGEYMFGNKPFTVINNAIDSEKFVAKPEIRNAIRAELGFENNFVIGHVGRFYPQKNHLFLIDIFAEIKRRCQNAKLVFVGSGEMESRIKEKISELKLENDVIFLGNRSDMHRVFQCFDVFAFPSMFEGLGIVAIEAQAAGTPVVCTDSLPQEINVSPLIYRLPLGDPKNWALTLQSAAINKYAHTDMRSFIKEANYDIYDVASYLENFYLRKINEKI